MTLNVDITDYGADPTGATDSTSEIQDAIDAVGDAGGGEVYVPAGDFLLATRYTGTMGVYWCLALSWDNVHIWGPGRLICNPPAGPACLFYVAGSMKASRIANAGDVSQWDDFWIWEFGGAPPSTPQYDLDSTLTFAKGSMELTLDDPADAVNFSVDDWIAIRTGEIGASVGVPDSELQQVTAVNQTAGVISVGTGLKTDYAQEYFIAGTAGPSSTTVTANPCQYTVGIVNDRLLHNVTLGPLNLRQDTVQFVIGGDQTINFLEQDLNVRANTYGLESFGRSRYHTVRDTQVNIYNGSGNGAASYWITADMICTDFLWENVNLFSDYPASLHINEGCARIVARNMEIHTPTIDEVTEHYLVGSAGRAYDIDIDSCLFEGGGRYAVIAVDTNLKGAGELSGHVHNCEFDNDLDTTPFAVGPNPAPEWIFEPMISEEVSPVDLISLVHSAGRGQ